VVPASPQPICNGHDDIGRNQMLLRRSGSGKFGLEAVESVEMDRFGETVHSYGKKVERCDDFATKSPRRRDSEVCGLARASVGRELKCQGSWLRL
jgi:hypothetical protein